MGDGLYKIIYQRESRGSNFEGWQLRVLSRQSNSGGGIGCAEASGSGSAWSGASAVCLAFFVFFFFSFFEFFSPSPPFFFIGELFAAAFIGVFLGGSAGVLLFALAAAAFSLGAGMLFTLAADAFIGIVLGAAFIGIVAASSGLDRWRFACDSSSILYLLLILLHTSFII